MHLFLQFPRFVRRLPTSIPKLPFNIDAALETEWVLSADLGVLNPVLLFVEEDLYYFAKLTVDGIRMLAD